MAAKPQGCCRPTPSGWKRTAGCQSSCETVVEVDAATTRAPSATARRRSHQALNDAPELDDGDRVELGIEYREIWARHSQISGLGGCCGTDHRHIEICAASLGAASNEEWISLSPSQPAYLSTALPVTISALSAARHDCVSTFPSQVSCKTKPWKNAINKRA